MKDWPSLAPQLALATQFYSDRAPEVFGAWFDQQIGLIDDASFAQEFHAHCDLPKLVQSDFNHRLVQTSAGVILGGIRFFGGDVRRPFVEVIAHTFGTDMVGLMAAVRAEWAGFAPLHLRLLLVPDEVQHLLRLGLGFQGDLSVHVAQHGRMTPPDGRVTLTPFEDVEQAVDLMSQRYEDVAKADPVLGRNLSSEPPDRLRQLHNDGHLRAIHHGTSVVGLLAIAPGEVAWIKGPVVIEEAVATSVTGQGFAGAAQAAWAAASPKEDLMIGTIEHLNHASRRTAERAGRPAVLHYGFLPLG